MRHVCAVITALGLLLLGNAATPAADAVPALDMSAFFGGSAVAGATDPVPEDGLPVGPGGRESNGQRFYLSGIVGASFATLTSGGTNTASGQPVANTGAVDQDLFTAGGAFGVALDRDGGLLRLEIEGRGRDALVGQTNSVFEPFTYAVQATDGWSVMANVWRDIFLTERIGIYAGGGIGGGGYRVTADDLVASGGTAAGVFAWQAGGGITYTIGPQMTLDLGYRFYDLGTASMPLTLADGAAAGTYTSAFSASELLLAVRIYKPFQRIWR